MTNLYDRTAFKTSKAVTKTYSTSFSLAVGIHKPQKRNAIYSIYGFVRLADEIVDTFLTCNQEELLDEFENEFHEALQRKLSMNPVIHAFVLTVNKYQIPLSLVKSFMKSMRQDLYKSSYKSTLETNDYVYGSAEVVGLMCLKVFVDGDDIMYNRLKEPAQKLGSAFQKVNFLRDLKADYEQLNRVYFSDFNEDTFNDSVKLKLIAEIKDEFKVAKIGIRKLPGRSKIAVYLAYLYYMQLLKKLTRTPAKQLMNKRIRVNNYIKFALLVKASVYYKMKLI